MSSRLAALSVIAAGSLWGCISLFVRSLTSYGLSSFEITGTRVIFACLLMVVIILATDRSKLRIRPRDIWMFVGTGIVSLLLFNFCYFSVIQLSEASIAVVLLYTSPVFVMLMSALFFHERITGRKVLALVMTFIGCILVAGVLGGSVRLTPQVLAIGVASGFLYAVYSIFGRVALQRYDNLTVNFYTFLCASVGSVLFVDYGSVCATMTASPLVIVIMLASSFFCAVLPYFLYNQGLKHLETSKAAILVTVEPLVGSLIGILVFAESVGVLKLLGIALILGAVVMLNLPDGKKE